MCNSSNQRDLSISLTNFSRAGWLHGYTLISLHSVQMVCCQWRWQCKHDCRQCRIQTYSKIVPICCCLLKVLDLYSLALLQLAIKRLPFTKRNHWLLVQMPLCCLWFHVNNDFCLSDERLDSVIATQVLSLRMSGRSRQSGWLLHAQTVHFPLSLS